MVAAVVRLIGDGVGGLASALRFGCLGAVAVAEPLGGVSASAVTVGEIATLNHEIIDDTVEDGAVVIAVLHEEFEVLHVNRGVVWIEFNGDRSAVGAAVPRQLKVDDVRGGVGSVGDVDHGQHEHTGEENRHDAGRRWGAIVEQAREGGLADALVLHFVQEVVVEAVSLLIPWVLLGGFP